MVSRISSHAIVGAASLGLGVLGGWMGLARPAWLSGAIVGTPFWVVALVAGCVLLLAGSLILLTAFRPPPAPSPTVPAHIAFQSRMKLPDATPTPVHTAPRPRVTTPPRPRTTPAPAAIPAAATTTPTAPVPPTREETMADLEGQIRDLTRKINKAGVMLATGQLSQQGYLTYVEDLKRQRAQLEAQRVTAELQS